MASGIVCLNYSPENAWCLQARLLQDKWLRKKHSARRNHNSDSNLRKRRSSSHCCVAFWLDFRKELHAGEGFSFPGESFAHAETACVKLSGTRHRLSPGRKLCSKLVR